MRSLVDRSKERNGVSAIRSAVPLLYAHWEGCIKKTSCLYADFISAQRLTYSQLKTSFAGLKAHANVSSMSDIKKRIFVTSELLDQIRLIDSERVHIDLWPFIGEVGNLNSDLFQQIARLLSIEADSYLSYKPLIDDSLLYHRNSIAHGERLEIDSARYDELHKTVVMLIERYKTDVENAAINKEYLR
jgi:hypothetical protein